MSNDFINVIDPQNRTGKIRIPSSLVFDTKGKQEALRATTTSATSRQQQQQAPKDFSLCLLFQNGKCNVGAKCHQIHADCEFVRKLRSTASQCSTCCAEHGCPQSKEWESDNRTVVYSTSTNIHVPLVLKSFAVTQGLTAAMHSNKGITVLHTRICRLHQQNRCKYGRDCRHIHMCRDQYNHCENPTTTKPVVTKSTQAVQKITITTPTPAMVHVSSVRITPPPVPLCPDLILFDDTASNHSSESASDSSNTSRGPALGVITPLPTKTIGRGPESTTAEALDTYLKGWTPSTTMTTTSQYNLFQESPMFQRSPLDLRQLCRDLFGTEDQ
eukprot:PhF_6_TR32412/c0_g1_i1/m.48092